MAAVETRLGAGSLALGFLGQTQLSPQLKRKRPQLSPRLKTQLNPQVKGVKRGRQVVVPAGGVGCVRAALEQASLLSLPLVVHLWGEDGSNSSNEDEAAELAGELGVPLLSSKPGEGRETASLAASLAPAMVLHDTLDDVPDIETETYLPDMSRGTEETPERYLYYGPQDASTVVLVFGPRASMAVQAASSLEGESGVNLGVVQARACPLDEGLLAVLPKSVRTVGVLGRVAAGGEGTQSALFRQALPLLWGQKLACVDLRHAGPSSASQLSALFRGFLGLHDTVKEGIVTADSVEEDTVKETVKEEDAEDTVTDTVTDTSNETVVKGLLFKEAFGTAQGLPQQATTTFTVHVRENRRLTPAAYDRHIFHIEFDLGDSGLTYEIGEALGVHPENDQCEVDRFASFYPLDQHALVSYPVDGQHHQHQQQTVHQALRRLDLFGRPPKRFYQELSEFAVDAAEKARLALLASPQGAAEFRHRAEVDMLTYADILQEFPSARPSLAQLARLVGPVKRREYSIASCQRVSPSTVALMVVVVGWTDGRGRRRHGQASSYLSALAPGCPVTVSVKPSVMKLPAGPAAPLIMAGLGTGLAPFRAFVQHRALEKAQGKEVGPVLLYIGSRHQREEYCYGEEWEAYAAAGVITLLSCAFSRDQQHKVYIQDRMRQTLPDISQAYLRQQGSFYLCGPTWPVPDVTRVLEEAVSLHARQTGTTVDPRQEIDRLKDQHRFVLEVY